MVETILLCLLIAKIKGYKIKIIFKEIAFYPLFIVVLVYIILEVLVFKGMTFFIIYTNLLKVLLFSSVFILVLKYKLYISSAVGSIFIFMGSILNKIAICSNNGKMPVFPTLSYLTGYIKPSDIDKVNDVHILGSSLTKYKPLTDIIDVGYSIMSIGDILIRFFVFIIMYKAIECLNKKLYLSKPL